MENFKSKIIVLIFCQIFFSLNAFAETPIIYTYSPQTIQYGVTDVTVTGVNLNSTVIGVSGNDVLAFVTKESQDGLRIAIQFAVRLTAEVGTREVFLRNAEGEEVRFPITVAPFGSPVIESISQNIITPGSPFLLYISGMGLNNATVTTPSTVLSIISSQSSSDGSLIVISGLLSDQAISGSQEKIYITTPGGQTPPIELSVASTIISEEGQAGFNNPYSPGISSVAINPNNKSQVILKGSMFDPDPIKNTVTLLENDNGNVISRQVEVVYSTNDEIIINLPQEGIDSDSISFAVSNSEGKSSNIKSVNFDSLLNTENTEENIAAAEIKSEKTNEIAANPANNFIDISTINNNQNNISSSQIENQQNSQKLIEKPHEKIPASVTSSGVSEDTSITQSIQQNLTQLTQYLFNPSKGEIKEEHTPSLNEVKDPAKLITTIEENKQIKSQADLLMLALDEAKQNEDLSIAIKKAESLKLKVEELEKLLSSEEHKNNPNPRKLAKYQEELLAASAESKSQTFALLNNLLKFKPQLKNLLSQRPFDLAAIQPNIPNDSVILQYVPTEEGLIIFVVDNKNLKTRINKYISKDILNREVQAYRGLLENEIEKIKQSGRVTPITSWKNDKSNTYKKEIMPLKEKIVFLYNALIEPVEKDIAGKKIVAVIANGWLRYLPFQSLAKPSKDGDLEFLISNKSVVYLDSVIAVSRNIPKTLPSMLSTITVFANPDGTLQGANKEAEIISKLFNKNSISFIQKPFNISLINQLAKKADILHLATHGFLDGTDINSSYLVSGKTNTGKKQTVEKLFLKDIYDLNLKNNNLIVLSGCDTGKLGNLSNEPDDIVGSLASAFRVAGANTILASLWKAHDEATKLLMQYFYENIKSGMDKAESLRKATIKIKENPKYGNPLFWSLFSLIGDWR